MNNQELAELDLATAQAVGITDARIEVYGGEPICAAAKCENRCYEPTRDVVEAMRLLEKHRFFLRSYEQGWICGVGLENGHCLGIADPEFGETICIAICRAVVALHKAKVPA